MRRTFAKTMLDVGREDDQLVVLVGDISHFALQPFAQACPGRFFNVGILEPTIVNMAAGLAHVGLFPVVHTITPFLIERSFEQIKLDFCYQKLGGTLISVGSAFDYSGLGCSHHCYDDFALIKALPGTEVVYPAMPAEFVALFRETYRNGRLTYFRLPEATHGCDLSVASMKLGQGIVVRQGESVTILAIGPQLSTAMKAAPVLESRGIRPEVLYFPTIKPFDSQLLASSVAKTKRLAVIEEHGPSGGVSEDALKSILGIDGVRVSLLTIPNEFQRGYGTYSQHLAACGLTPENLVAKITELCKAA